MILAGSSTIDITPPVGYPLAGFAARHAVSQGVHDPLQAKALVVDSGAGVAIVTADLVSFPNRMVREIREKASARTGIPEQAIMLCSSPVSYTHLRAHET